MYILVYHPRVISPIILYRAPQAEKGGFSAFLEKSTDSSKYTKREVFVHVRHLIYDWEGELLVQVSRKEKKHFQSRLSKKMS